MAKCLHLFALAPQGSQLVAHHDTPTTKSSNFAQFPSWVTLKCSPSSAKAPSNQSGQVENLHLVSLSKQGKLREAREFLETMDEAGISVNPVSYECLFQACGKSRSVSDGRLVHDLMRRSVKNPSGFLQNCVLQMYCDFGSCLDAQRVFDEMTDQDLSSWVIMISAYTRARIADEAFWLFSRMLGSEIRPNSSIYISLLKSLVKPSLLEVGKQVHCQVIKTGPSSTVAIDTAITNMYLKCGWLEGAKLVFDRMTEKNAVAWTALMVGYIQAGKEEKAVELFAKTVRERIEMDQFVFSAVLRACVLLEDVKLGRQIHGFIVKLGWDSQVSVGTPLVDFYAKCASLESACQAFERICEPNEVTWSTIITGYCQNGKFEESNKLFKSIRSKDVELNCFIYTSIFQACSALGDFIMGAQAHADAVKRGLISYLFGESAMITMYSKCGRLDYAFRAFESIDEPDTVAWTAVLSAYAYHGKASKTLKLFRRMQDSGERPNAVTFVAVLTACSHSGLVTEAMQYLESMSVVYGIEPAIDHYDCMVDVYSRAGLLQEAYELIKNMPLEPDEMTWKCLLGGCLVHRNLELGKIAAENLLLLDPEDASGYILMFNLYASFGKWEEAARVRKIMAERKLKKQLSCSWITVKDKVHRFIVGDKHHPLTKEIYSKLEELDHSIIKDENRVLTEKNVPCGMPERKEQLLHHSERLAISFGLISTPKGAPIVVFKNLRACKDCHEFAKHVSAVTGREIVVRDSCRFHSFRSGQCSCNDYW